MSEQNLTDSLLVGANHSDYDDIYYSKSNQSDPNEEIEQLKARIKELEQPEPLRDFCYDLQEWVKQFVLDIDGFKNYYAYQDIRKAAYTYIKSQKKIQPTWGDESYYDKRYETFPRPSFFELENEIRTLKAANKELVETVKRLSNDNT